MGAKMAVEGTRRGTVGTGGGRHANRRRRSWTKRAAAALTALALGVVGPLAAGAPPADAAVVGTVTTAFEIDGNMAGAADWDGAGYGPGTTPGTPPRPTTGLLDRVDVTDPCVGDGSTGMDPTGAPGTQTLDGTWAPGPANVNAKGDLCGGGATYEIVLVDGQQHIIFYAYWLRAPEGSGDLSVFYEFEGGAAGRDGDRLLEFDYDSSGSGTVTVKQWSWDGSSWVLGGSMVFQATTGPNPDYADANVGTFGEMAVDLTASGFLPSTECRTFTTGTVVSRTGEAASGNQLQDFLPEDQDLTISNCGGITVQKVVQGTAPAGLTFTYVIDQADAMPVHGPTGATGPVSDTDASVNSITASIAAGGSQTWTNVLAQPDYRVVEVVSDLPAGVTALSVVCTYQNWYVAGHPTQQVTVWQNGEHTGSVVPIFPSSIGATAPTCVITNQVTSLTLDKILVNDHGGPAAVTDFRLTATPAAGGSAAVDGTDTDPDAGSTLTGLVAPGQYTLSETTVAGYDASAWTCTNGALVANVVTVNAGASVSCTITNDDRPALLTLVKRVVNDNGGTAADTAFTLTATGPTPGVSGVEGDPAVTGAQVTAGTYTIGEEPFSGYTMTGVLCWTSSARTTPVAVGAGNEITLANGATAYCEITNDDQQGMLTLVKQVDNRDGGTAAPTAWTLSATGPAPGTSVAASGAGGVANVPVDAGDYSLAETAGPTGYSAGTWSCDAGALSGSTITVPNGVHVTCTIVNDDIAPLLTLVKQVVNDDGGTAEVGAWTLTATGSTPGVSGATGDAAISGRAVTAGTYSLSEAGPAGYAASAWDCEGGTQNTPTSIMLAVGESATCTIVNDDIPATLTLRKVVVNDDGGSAQADEWTLTASGPTPGVTGSHGEAIITAVEVSAGVYQLSETDGPSGYSASAWACTAGQLQGSTLTLANGVTAVCTITNDDAAPNLTLLKTVVNDNGGAQLDTAWTLAAEGPSDAVTGREGDAAITDRLIEAGSYDLSESGPAGYMAGQWVCAGGSQQGATVDIGPGEDVTCTITNDDIPPTITLVKTVVNDDGGTALSTAWTLSADGPLPEEAEAVSGTSGSPEVTSRIIDAGTFALAESGGPAGYAAGAWQCSAGVLDGASLTLEPGQNATCTIENDDQPAELTLIKLVENDSGGTSVDTAWRLTATRDAETAISGVTGDRSITDAPVPAGDYTLTESGPGGYAQSVWTCDGAPVTAAGVVTVPNGGDVSCTIINRDIAPTLTLIKRVVNDDGGSAGVDHWTLTADGPALLTGASGVNGAVLAGDYELSESGPEGYATDGWSCDGGSLEGETLSLALDEDVTCTIVNDDIAPLLTLVKQVVNDDGGEAVAADWTLSADGSLPEGADAVAGDSGTAAVTGRTVRAGTFELEESGGPAGYTASAWTCTDGTMEGSSVTLRAGDVAVCTIVNHDEPVDLQLTKDDGGVNAGAGGEFDYTITVTNVGDRPVDGDEPVTVVDELPAGFSLADGPATCSAAGQIVTCDVDPALLMPGESVAIVLTVAVAPETPPGTYVNLAFVTTEDDEPPGDIECPNESNNIDCEETPVFAGTVSGVKSAWEQQGTWVASDGRVSFGDTVQYRIVVTASGDAASTGVVMVDTLEDGLTSTAPATCSVTCSATFDTATGTHRIEIGTMLSGSSVTITFMAMVPAAPSHAAGTTVTGTFDNVAAVESDIMPRTPTNIVTLHASHTIDKAATGATAPPPILPRTGGELPLEIVGLGLALIIGGGLALLRRREGEPQG